jgi:biopolymer transport protein ExbD
MRHLFNPKPLLVAFTAFSAAHTGVALGEQPLHVVTIKITDGSSCLVDDANVPCAEMAARLRDVLKVPEGTHLRILPDKATSYEATANIVEQLQKSKLKVKMGYVNVAEAPKD